MPEPAPEIPPPYVAEPGVVPKGGYDPRALTLAQILSDPANWSDVGSTRQSAAQGVPAPLSAYNWQAMPEGGRLGLMAHVLRAPLSNAERTLASMAAASNQAHAPAGLQNWQRYLPSDLERLFERWVRKNDIQFNPFSYFPDYDMRQWWLDASRGNPQATFNMSPNFRPLFPPRYTTPYSVDFGPNSMYWRGPPR